MGNSQVKIAEEKESEGKTLRRVTCRQEDKGNCEVRVEDYVLFIIFRCTAHDHIVTVMAGHVTGLFPGGTI